MRKGNMHLTSNLARLWYSFVLLILYSRGNLVIEHVGSVPLAFFVVDTSLEGTR